MSKLRAGIYALLIILAIILTIIFMIIWPDITYLCIIGITIIIGGWVTLYDYFQKGNK